MKSRTKTNLILGLLLLSIATLLCMIIVANKPTTASAASIASVQTLTGTESTYHNTFDGGTDPFTGLSPYSESTSVNTGIRFYTATDNGLKSSANALKLNANSIYVDFSSAQSLYRPARAYLYIETRYSFSITNRSTGRTVWSASCTGEISYDMYTYEEVYNKYVNINGSYQNSNSKDIRLLQFLPSEFGIQRLYLDDGIYTVSISRTYEWTDLDVYCGNQMYFSSSSLSGTLTIDTSKLSMSMGGYSSGSTIANGAYTKERVNFNVNGTNTYRLYYKTPTSGSYTYTTSRTYTSSTTNGWYYAYAEDAFGDVTPTYSVYYDTATPTGTIHSNGNTVTSGSYIGGGFSYSATDSGSGVANLYYKTPVSGTYLSYSSGTIISANSGDGWYYFYAVDRAGNQSSTSSVFLETTAPHIEIFRNDTLAYTKDLSSSGTYDTDIYLNPDDRIKVTCATSSGRATCNYSLGTNTTIDGTYTASNYTITITSVTGKVGNFNYHIVRNKPTITIDGRTYTSGSTLYFNADKTVTFADDSVIANSGNTGATIRSSLGTDFVSYASGNGKSLTSTVGSETRYSLTLNDRAGNESTFTVYIDKAPPTGVWKAKGTTLANNGYTNGTLSFEFTEADITARYSLNGGSSAAYLSGTPLTAEGRYTVVLTDRVGNQNTYAANIDKTAPVGIVHSGGNVVANAGYTGKSFSYTATDNGSGVASIYCKTPVSGTYLSYTSGMITPANSDEGWYYFYAVDTSGNQSAVYSVFLETAPPHIEIYRNDNLAYGIDLTSSGTHDTDIYLRVNDTIKITCSTSSGKATCNYPLDTNITIDNSYTANDYTIIVTSVTGIVGNFGFKIVHNKPEISVDGTRYKDGATLYFNADKTVTFYDDSVISSSKNTGASVEWNNGSDFVAYLSAAEKTLTTLSNTETQYSLTLNDRAGNESTFTVYIDKAPPTGVWKTKGNTLANGGYTNGELGFEFTESGVSATYSYNGSEYLPYTSGYTLERDGVYNVVLTDIAGNKSTFTASVDTIPPTGQLYANYAPIDSGSITNGRVVFTWDNDLHATVNGQAYTKNSPLTDSGVYKFVLTDLAENATEYLVTIDTNAPVHNSNKLLSFSQMISKWFTVNFEDETYSFAEYNEALAFACGKEFSKSVTTLVLNDVSSFNQHHLIADGSEVRVGEYWLYKSRANKDSFLYYFDRNALNEVVAYYAKNYVSGINYYEHDGDNVYGISASSMTDNLLTAPNKTAAPTLNGFVFDRADGYELYAELVGGNGTKIKIEYGISFDEQVKVGGLYKFTEADEAGNETVFYGFYDTLSPELKVTATIYGNDTPTELNITKDMLSGIAAYYYESFRVSEIADADKWAVLSVKNDGKTNHYTYGDNLPCLNVGGEYLFNVYDRFGNGYSFTVYIVGNPATITIRSNAENTAFDIAVSLEQKFDTVVALEIRRNGNLLDGVSTSVLSYTFDKAGTYTLTLRDNFGRTITKEYVFNKALPSGELIGVENGGKTKTNVTFTYDNTKFYAVVSKDGKELSTEYTGKTIVTATDTSSGYYVIRLIRLTDDENFTDYSFTVNTLSPLFDLTVSDGVTTNKNVTVSWTESDIASVVYSLNNGETVTLENGASLSAEGNYIVTATNDLGTVSSKTFTIDKTLDYELLINDVQTAGVDTTSSDITVINNEPLSVGVIKNGEPFAFEFGEVLSEEGYYNFRIFDEYGNTASFTVVIDKSVDVTATAGNGVISNNAVTITAGEKVKLIATKDGAEYSYDVGSAISEEGFYKFTAYDAYGNEKSFTFRIVKGTKTKLDYALGENVVIKSVTRNGESVAFEGNTLNYTTDGTYIVVCESDGQEYTFTLSLDTTAPTISLNGIRDGGKGNVTVTITDLSETGAVEVYKDGAKIPYELGGAIKEYGNYEVRVSDELGNMRTYKFVLEYRMNGGAVALIAVGIMSVCGIAVATVLGKRAVYKRKSARAVKPNSETEESTEEHSEDTSAE